MKFVFQEQLLDSESVKLCRGINLISLIKIINEILGEKFGAYKINTT